ncbi:MAG TPA: aldehyde dehydrogenase family protein, partial [Roseiflexaceae bacterium]|nr:aldehyde dehydrogenase family protein [Roseiflexaceae bacterium]
GEVGDGNRKDLRIAVEAARNAAASWASQTAHNRAQILYYIAENLSARSAEFARRLQAGGDTAAMAAAEVEAAIEALFNYAAWADKYDGAVHHTPLRNVTLAMPEPIGVLAIACPDPQPLAAFVALLAPAIAMGNSVVIIPSAQQPLSATDFYQVLDTSDVPAGVVNIVTGVRDPLALVLAEHADVDAIWYAGSDPAAIERATAGNLKRSWMIAPRDWLQPQRADVVLRQAIQWKNIWVPYGA